MHVKTLRTTLVERTFSKEKSVFADWRVDQDNTAKLCIEHDLQLWHADKFIKDDEDREKTADVMRKYATQIKNMFIQSTCRSTYPQISANDFSALSNRVEFPDAPGQGVFKSSMVDTQYIAANNNTAPMPGLDPSLHVRYKFIEAIARVAQAKFTNQQRVGTTWEAVEKLFEDHLIPKYPWEPWQEFRESYCYTLEVNDVLDANLDGISGLISHYFAPRKSFMSRKDVISLFTKDSNANMAEKVALYCFGMSKMTVVRESVTPKQYDIVLLPEFCEMIGRLADTRYKNQA